MSSPLLPWLGFWLVLEISTDVLSRCNALVNAAHEKGVALDVKLLNRLLKIHTKHVIDGKPILPWSNTCFFLFFGLIGCLGDTTAVLRVYKQIKDSVKPDVKTYNILLEMYSSLDSDKGTTQSWLFSFLPVEKFWFFFINRGTQDKQTNLVHRDWKHTYSNEG